jgi:peptidoglycan/LPS O-acetylase OafA/YrhL
MTRTAGANGLSAPAYRPDIDGLRGFAVLSVILYHAEVPGIGGGFVGVDVFFVISGYLITQLLPDGDGGIGGRLKSFYARRARRILPALLVMLAIVTAAALIILLPAALVSFGRYLAATPVFLANVNAWLGADYFAPQFVASPLLHLWSIAVEEQFYLVYPLALMLLSRIWPRHRVAAIGLIGLLSLALSAWGASRGSSSNFYLPLTRAWELLTGAAIAVRPWRLPQRRVAREALAAAALAVLALAASNYRASMPYPGLPTLPVCFATALLLTDDTRQTAIHRLLAWRPLVLVGLASYSLYLWHAPVLTFLRYVLIRPPGPAAVAAGLALTAALAFASWRFIEQPVRSRRVLASNARFAWLALAASVLLALCGIAMWHSKGWATRFAPAVQALDPLDDEFATQLSRCIKFSEDDIDAGQFCEYGPAGPGVARVVVWGDSHAWAMLSAYHDLADRFEVHLYYAGRSSCKAILYPPREGAAERVLARCDSYNRAMLRAIERLRPRLVILNSYWSQPPDGLRLPPQRAVSLPVPLDVGIGAVLDRIEGPDRSTCIVLDPPTLAYGAPYAVAMSVRRGIDPAFIRPTRADAYAQYRIEEEALRRLAPRPRLQIVDPKEALCPSTLCDVYRDGRLLYIDSNHLSVAGAARVEGVLARCFEDFALPPALRPAPS